VAKREAFLMVNGLLRMGFSGAIKQFLLIGTNE